MKINISKKKNRILIEDRDIWNLHSTLASIIHPALIKYKKDSHSYFFVDLEDLPEEMRKDYDENYKKMIKNGIENDYDEKILLAGHEYIIDFMIWSFGEILKEGTDDDIMFLYDFNHKNEIQKYNEHMTKINKGTTLFGKYFSHLWD